MGYKSPLATAFGPQIRMNVHNITNTKIFYNIWQTMQIVH